MSLIWVEVAYATAEKQLIIPLQVAMGTSMYEAAVASNIAAKFPALDLAQAQMGIFGKVEVLPKQRLLQAGDRVEIYRPLTIDPKEARRARAKKTREKKIAAEKEG